jgi:mono/diheme cytochrome c family protein
VSLRSTAARVYVGLLSALATLGGLLMASCRTGPNHLTPAQRGEVVYRTNCASCHGPDPKRPGSLGPAIAGSPRALIEARVLRRAYPSGYLPKRRTHLMQAMPWMAGHINDLTSYLAVATDQTSDIRAGSAVDDRK